MAEESADRVQLANGNYNSTDVSPQKQAFIRKHNLQQIKEKAQKCRRELCEQLSGNFTELVDEIITQVEDIEETRDAAGAERRRKRGKNGELPDKEFVSRQSILTELLEIDHIRTIYHIFVAILIVFSLNTVVYDIFENGLKPDLFNFEVIVWGFGKLPIVMTIWVCMLLANTVVLYPLFQHWAWNRPKKVGYYDYVYLALYIAYILAFLILPVITSFQHQLPIASKLIAILEQVRLIMKAHAFVRYNIPRAINYKPKSDDDVEDVGGPCPDFSKYLYFLFAPTLVYRNSYPRTPTVRWNYVISNLLQVVACLFYIHYIFARFCIPVFQNFNSSSINARKMVLGMFGCMLPGTLVLFTGFFALLHSWLNAFAEMLRFGDRLFYKDWWNSSSFSNYYRTWNVVVHDWLYSYVYKDVDYLMKGRCRALSMAAVFGLSAFVHEYVICVACGFFYPILFVMFGGVGFGLAFISDKANRRIGNIMMWVMLFSGTGTLFALYSMEWYARRNCPAISDNWLLNELIPHSWFCGVKFN
ncbi:sterol O-acyltransferase 1-like isoform X1 [Tubulanus polymorphus]|uniref:sterol O-acyltransferase 1-like isoform X1 n=1 Tax=Tubulanus polymorphus TaxID=672921 RepID=UPI003DA392FB